jgi:hypothetical protein
MMLKSLFLVWFSFPRVACCGCQIEIHTYLVTVDGWGGEGEKKEVLLLAAWLAMRTLFVLVSCWVVAMVMVAAREWNKNMIPS